MELFVVWDPENEDESDGKTVYAPNNKAAAICYAERDHNGIDGGLYTLDGAPLEDISKGHRLYVRDSNGELTAFFVGVTDFCPQFDAKQTAAREGRA